MQWTLAYELQPDVIFLLADGNYLEDDLPIFTRPNPQRRCVINTFGMGSNAKGARNLAIIADSNRGAFVPVQPHPAAVQMSQTVKFKINRSRGTVWGQKVR